jgi:hypothetical protein
MWFFLTENHIHLPKTARVYTYNLTKHDHITTQEKKRRREGRKIRRRMYDGNRPSD